MKTQLSLVAAITLMVITVSVHAHHPFAAEYDWTKPVTLTGTVSKLEWTNPHAMLYIDGKDDSGQMKHWTLEMGGIAALTRAGWTRTTLKMGDEVTVMAWMSKTKPDKANAKSVMLPDGRELSAASSIADVTPSKTPVSN
jgi:hypothetical protein